MKKSTPTSSATSSPTVRRFAAGQFDAIGACEDIEHLVRELSEVLCRVSDCPAAAAVRVASLKLAELDAELQALACHGPADLKTATTGLLGELKKADGLLAQIAGSIRGEEQAWDELANTLDLPGSQTLKEGDVWEGAGGPELMSYPQLKENDESIRARYGILKKGAEAMKRHQPDTVLATKANVESGTQAPTLLPGSAVTEIGWKVTEAGLQVEITFDEGGTASEIFGKNAKGESCASTKLLLYVLGLPQENFYSLKNIAPGVFPEKLGAKGVGHEQLFNSVKSACQAINKKTGASIFSTRRKAIRGSGGELHLDTSGVVIASNIRIVDIDRLRERNNTRHAKEYVENFRRNYIQNTDY